MVAPVLGTPFAIISDAMEDAGLLMEGTAPNSEDVAKYSRRLLKMINFWQTQGLKLWLDVDQSITLTSGKGGQGNPYTLGSGGDVDMAKPLQVLQAYYLTTASGQRRPVTPLSWNEWLLLANTTQTGEISQYFVDKQPTLLRVHTWLIPNAAAAANGTLHLLLRGQVTNFTNLTDVMNFPTEWALALEWGLADLISTGQPTAIVQKCAANAMQFRAALEDWDVEDTSTTFQVDARTNQGFVGRFM